MSDCDSEAATAGSRRFKRSAAVLQTTSILERIGDATPSPSSSEKVKKLKPDPATEEEKKQAKSLFVRWIRRLPYRNSVDRDRYNIPELLNHLKTYPFLKGMRFENRHSKKVSVFAAFLIAQADLQTIEEVFQLTGYDRFADVKTSALLTACRYGAREGVIEFLLEKLPGSIKSSNKDGKNALEFVLESNRSNEAKAEIVSLLLTMRPTLIMHGSENHGKRHREDIFHKALRDEYGDTITILIFNNLAELMRKRDAVRYFSLYPSNSFFHLRQVSALSMVLPHLTKLDCMPHGWSYEGYQVFLENLSRTRHLKFMSLTMQTNRFSGDNGDMARRLSRAIRNSRLTRIAMMAISSNDSGHEECFQAIVDAVNSNPRLTHVRLEGFALPRSDPLSALISGRGNNLKVLLLESVTVRGPWRRSSHCEQSVLEELDIRSCNLISDAFVGMLSQICEMPKLKRLHLDTRSHEPYFDGTQMITTLLQQSTLKFLNLSRILLDWKKVSNLLKRDDKLEKLSIFTTTEAQGKLVTDGLVEALEGGNTTLQHAVVMSPKPNLYKIEFLTALNRAGRARALGECQSLREFVNLLVDVTNQQSGCGPSSALNVVFGLLSLAPALWSSAIRTKAK